MAKIVEITGREVLDSRGVPTVEATVICEGGYIGTAKVPAGISTGRHEAVELRDGDTGRYSGQGVLKAVKNIETEIQQALVGLDSANQEKIDRILIELDGMVDKSRLGANTMLAVSCAVSRVEAASQGVPLYTYLHQLSSGQEMSMPVPQMNLINGGRHASNGISVQEFHVMPVGSPSFSEALRMGAEIYQSLRKILIDENISVEVAREGGFAPALDKSEEAFSILVSAIEAAGYVPGVDAFLGIDVAATEFYDKESDRYVLDDQQLTAANLGYQYKTWREKYPLISVEDPFAEDAWEEWKEFLPVNGKYMQIIGDDLYVTNQERIRDGIAQRAANAVLIKPNQVGTLTETLQACGVAQEAGHNVIVSHRSGETEDTFIADLSVAIGAGQIKTGAPARSERTAKYNRLLAIEEETGSALSHDLQPYLEHVSK